MSIFRPKTPNAKQPTKLLGYPVQTSIYGKAIPLVFGCARIAPNVIWTGDWKANPVKAQGGKGGLGKGSGGGKGGNSGQQYTYQSAIILALCGVPIQGIGHIWIDKVRMRVNYSDESFQIPLGGGNYTPRFRSTLRNNLGVSRQDAYSVTADDYGSPGEVQLTGTQNTPLVRVNSNPGAGEYIFNEHLGLYGFSAADGGKTVSIRYTWTQETGFGTGDPVSDLSFAIFTGQEGQAAWDYLASKHWDQAIGYSGTAYAASELLDLGSTGVVSSYSFEVLGPLQFGGGIVDAERSAVFDYLLTNTLCGASWPESDLGNLTEFRNYCVANSLFVSPVIDAQRNVAEVLNELLSVGNSAPVWSEGKLKIRCFGDTTAVGNGVTYTPNNAPIYDLDYTDFIASGEALTQRRIDVREVYNKVEIEWLNRGNNYNAETLAEQEDWHVNTYGLRAASVQQLHLITSSYVAGRVANTAVQRNIYIRNHYRFKLNWRYALLEPMDLVTITDPYRGLDKFPVRILSIDEGEDFTYDIEAEEFPWGTATATINPKQEATSFGPGYFANPGNVRAPIFWEATSEQSQELQYKLLMGLSGSVDWGGCTVWMSTDGTDYKIIGKQTGASTMGHLTTPLPTNDSETDTTHIPEVDLTDSGTELFNYNKLQTQAGVSLCLIDQELLAYKTAVLIGPNKYQLVYLQRGFYGTPIQPHATAAKFLFFDDATFLWDYDLSDVGQKRYFKFTSFNTAGQMEQKLESVAAYEYVIKGPRRPYPWYPGGTHAASGDALYLGRTFTLQNVFIRQKDESILPQYWISGRSIVNRFSKATRPPSIALNSIQTTGGFIPGGTTVAIAAFATDTAGHDTDLSDMLIVTVPEGTNTNRILCDLEYATAGDVGEVCVGSPGQEAGLWTFAALPTDANGFEVTSVIPSGNSCPNGNFNNFFLQAREAYHIGIWGGTAGEVSPFTVQIPGANFASGSLIGRILLLISKSDFTPMPWAHYRIAENTADVLTLDANPVGVIVPGDLVAIDAHAVSSDALSVTDPLFVNGGPGQPGAGLVPSAEKGKAFIVWAGKGAHQPAVLIEDNTNDTVMFSSPLQETLDSTSLFAIVDPNWSATSQGATLNASAPTTVNLTLSTDNTQGKTWQVQVLTQDRKGLLSDDEHSPFRFIYQPGKESLFTSELSIIVTDDYTVDGTYTLIHCDTTDKSIVIQLPPKALLAGKTITIDKITADTNTVTILPATGETIDYADSVVLDTRADGANGVLVIKALVEN